ncbi:MAG: trypsin-like serine protease, partial [Ilumatobacteraceae bacterium]
MSEAETGRDDDLVSGLVVGGADTEITEVPWQAALLNSHLDEDDDSGFVDQFCGATVVSEEWLVTAAHCVDEGKQASEVEVAVGKTSLFDIASSDRHQLSEIVVSPSWDDSEEIGPDIALLRLAAPLVLDGVSVAAARLPAESLGATWPEIGHELTVSGWGCTAEVGVGEDPSVPCESETSLVPTVLNPAVTSVHSSLRSLTRYAPASKLVGKTPVMAIAVGRWYQLRMERRRWRVSWRGVTGVHNPASRGFTRE